jgi:hypothetical protein
MLRIINSGNTSMPFSRSSVMATIMQQMYIGRKTTESYSDEPEFLPDEWV